MLNYTNTKPSHISTKQWKYLLTLEESWYQLSLDLTRLRSAYNKANTSRPDIIARENNLPHFADVSFALGNARKCIETLEQEVEERSADVQVMLYDFKQAAVEEDAADAFRTLEKLRSQEINASVIETKMQCTVDLVKTLEMDDVFNGTKKKILQNAKDEGLIEDRSAAVQCQGVQPTPTLWLRIWR